MEITLNAEEIGRAASEYVYRNIKLEGLYDFSVEIIQSNDTADFKAIVRYERKKEERTPTNPDNT